MFKTITSNQLLGEIGETAVRLRFLNMGFQFDGRSRLEAGVDGIAEVKLEEKPRANALGVDSRIASDVVGRAFDAHVFGTTTTPYFTATS
jgi:hypothetical protein